jgi:hypothetical protein
MASDLVAKPLDIGNGLVASSLAPDAGVLVVGMPHPRLGYAVLDTAAPFDDAHRRDPGAVRRYRLSLATDHDEAMGVRPPDGWTRTSDRLDGGAVPRHRLQSGPLAASVVTTAPRDDDGPMPCIVQRLHLQLDGTAPPLAWTGRVRLGRAALTQLTEGGPLPALSGSQRVVALDDGFVVERSDVDLAAAIVVRGAGSWSFTGSADGHLRARLHTWHQGMRCEVTVSIALANSAEEARQHAWTGATGDVERNAAQHAARWRRRLAALPERLSPAVRPLVTRALVYAMDCCVTPSGRGSCIITDHRILPLSWTRDGYYIARMLAVALPGVGRRLVRRHLRWMFETCDRPAGIFARSYLPNGAVKDPAFQLDQQCYPVLELVDYLERDADRALAADLTSHVVGLLDTLERYRDATSGLYRTDETPGDDPLDLPYHFSSHVLLWHTMRRLATLPLPGVDTAALHHRATALRRVVRAAFAVPRSDGGGFAYAVDDGGRRLLYHDANDLPTALAPRWGFCAPDEPRWRATMAHAFSTANGDGWYPGTYGGLGSIHTPGAWPLGDVQEYIYAGVIGDIGRAQDVIDRLATTACRDGALPEARDPATGQVRSRHWFGWPGAALTLALLDPGFR